MTTSWVFRWWSPASREVLVCDRPPKPREYSIEVELVRAQRETLHALLLTGVKELHSSENVLALMLEDAEQSSTTHPVPFHDVTLPRLT